MSQVLQVKRHTMPLGEEDGLWLLSTERVSSEPVSSGLLCPGADGQVWGRCGASVALSGRLSIAALVGLGGL